MNKAPNKTDNSISILGCGWLGLPLAKHLINKGFEVKGSTSSEEKIFNLKNNGINSFKIFLNPELNEDFEHEFFNSEILIINIPPRRRDDIEEFHPMQFQHLLKQVENSIIKKIIFVSSTSVYASLNRIVSEKDDQIPEKSSGRALRQVERMIMNLENTSSCIVRFGGLIGYDRKPGRFFSSKKMNIDGESPVNLVHQDDCIGIIQHILENELYGEIYNGCSPEHPNRKDFYEAAAKIGEFPLPSFSAPKSPWKEICSAKIENTGFKFKFQNPIDALPF